MPDSDNRLEQTISKGVCHFLFFRGVCWGLGVATLMIAWNYYHDHSAPEMVQVSIPRLLIGFPIAGVVMGGFKWIFLKRDYDKRQKAASR